MSIFDQGVAQLSQWSWIAGDYYAVPAHIVSVPDAWSGTFYKATALPMTTTQQVTYSVPEYYYKGHQVMPTSNYLGSNLGMMNGAAPNSGIYTGIPSGCSNGAGGNPYS